MPRHGVNIEPDMWAQIEAEAKRLDRSPSWMAQRAWSMAREVLEQEPSCAPCQDLAQDPKTRVNLYFDAATVAEIEAECKRLDRSASWLLIHVWALARQEVLAFPAAPCDPDAE